MLRLTQTVQKGGCAAKVAATELRKILADVRFPSPHAELLIDGRHFDDAAIYQINPELALVQTIDFFTPIVDDPFTFGRVAACNALSDVYAMGGRPRTALAVLAFPLAELETPIITQVLQGAADMVGQAGANFVGGHSIDDDTLKFGLSVTGFVHPERIWSNQGAKAGDALILTKALGTGTITAALKRQAITEAEMQDAIDSMCLLNNVIDFASEPLAAAIHAATDITGFGLSGHSWQMAKASQKRFIFNFAKIPILDRAQEMLEREFLTKAHRTNRAYTQDATQTELSGWKEQILHDPQTSGGLLLSVDASLADELLQSIKGRFPKAALVGHVAETGHGKQLVFI